MHRPTLMIAATLLAVSSAASATEVFKCSDRAGHMTLTDTPCASGSAAIALHTPTAMSKLANQPAPAASSTSQFRSGASMSRDVATLKAARANLQLQDSAAAASRKQRYATLN